MRLWFPFTETGALFRALFSVIYTLNDDTKDTESIIRTIISSTFANKDVKAHVRLNVGVILFNLVFSGESKCEVLNGKPEHLLLCNSPSWRRYYLFFSL
jgi:hypothetical protein